METIFIFKLFNLYPFKSNLGALSFKGVPKIKTTKIENTKYRTENRLDSISESDKLNENNHNIDITTCAWIRYYRQEESITEGIIRKYFSLI